MTVLQVAGLSKSFPSRRDLLGRVRERVHAVRDVSFDIAAGETLAIVGETGAGKSTVGRMVLRLIEPDRGSVVLDGVDVRRLDRRALRRERRHMQMIFQDPFSSLDRMMTVGATLREAVLLHHGGPRAERQAAVHDLLRAVGLRADHADRFPHEFSGGQLQRVAVARALAARPKLIVCDEPVSALDSSIRAQVINLLLQLQRERGISYLFVSHDLSVVRHVAHRVLVMRHGDVVESGTVDEIFEAPREAYTRELLAAVPLAVPNRPRARDVQVPVAAYRREVSAP